MGDWDIIKTLSYGGESSARPRRRSQRRLATRPQKAKYISDVVICTIAVWFFFGENTYVPASFFIKNYFTVQSITDLSQLQALIDKAKAISNEDGTYTEESFASLQSAIEVAEAALKTIETEEELEIALTDLQLAIDGLELVDGGNEPITISDILKVLSEHEEELTSETYRALEVHLTAVGQYEKKGEATKIIKHMKNFNKLLDYQLGDNSISQELYEILKADADLLIQKWEDA